MENIKIITKSIEVEAETRELRSSWTPEIIKDLNMFHHIDASTELEKLLNSEINREIRKKKIENILKHMD